MNERYHLGEYAKMVADQARQLDADAVPTRLHAHDHTLWNDDPTEISDRLDWLTLPTDMGPSVAGLSEFGDSLQREGCTHVVLLGMGGSSLGPEVIRRVIGSKPGYPQLLTLDSTVPQSVAAATQSIDPETTIYIVSSKSGTTTEPNAFYAHFRDLMNEQLGLESAGRHFVAVTDAGTPLHRLADAHGFRRAFLNNPNIGGRYSVLSHFGLAPAALIGVDLRRLLGRAADMQQLCLSAEFTFDNPGARLGAVIGTLAKAGRDKLTLVASPSLEGFGLWVEQLLAESTGKDGKGVIPVAGESLSDPEYYGDDRVFVHLRLASDDNDSRDEMVDRLGSGGHPVVRLELADVYDLGAEFYRWEYATSIAGHILGIHPFEQPDVQGAKNRTVSVLQQYERDGELPTLKAEDPSSLVEMLAARQPGDYLAVMAYLDDAPESQRALDGLRTAVMLKYGIATTVGYGPRFLHSTGQLHKGGPDSGIYLQLTQQHPTDVNIPGWPFSFGILADAQALGDYQALHQLGRRLVSIRLGNELAWDLHRLVDCVAA